MCRLPILIVALVVGAVCPGQAPPQQPLSSSSNAKQPPPCTVSGRVVTAADGQPLKSALVSLLQEGAQEQEHPKTAAAYTDGDGHFEITKIAPGRYHFAASHTGYVVQQYREKSDDQGALLALTPGQELKDVLFRLVREGAITGRIVDVNGEPMPSVRITVLRKPTADEIQDWDLHKLELMSESEATTDDRGEYRAWGLRPGEYYVKVSPSEDIRASNGSTDMQWKALRELGTPYTPMYYPGVVQLDQAESVVVRAGDEVQADLTLRKIKTVTVSGKVIGSDTTRHVMVSLTVPETGDEELNGQTEQDGSFRITNVPPGNYILAARIWDRDKSEEVRQKLEVGEQNIDSLVLAFGRGVTITGRVLSASGPLPDYGQRRILLMGVGDDRAFSWSEVKKDGTFQFTDVADGSYMLRIPRDAQQQWYVKSARWGAEDVLEKGVQVEKGNSAGTLEIVFSKGVAQLEGTVTDGGDKPIVAAQVRLTHEPATPYNRGRGESTTTDQNGHFLLSSVPPGKYRVVARIPSATPDVPSLSSEPQTVTLNERDHQQIRLTLTIPPATD